jgi:hypothetical protein
MGTHLGLARPEQEPKDVNPGVELTIQKKRK